VRPRLHEVVRDVAGAMVGPSDLPELLHRLTEHASAMVGAVGAGILLRDRQGHLRFGAASEDRIMDVEHHQQLVEEGACWQAYTDDRVVVAEDLRHDERWPSYTARALEHGFVAVVGVPMRAYGRTIGVMNVYRETAGPWSDEACEAAEVLAALGAGYVAHAAQLRDQEDLTDQLQRAIDSRDLIGQAKGIVMAHRQVDAGQAFSLLRVGSQSRNVKLRDIAQAVIDGRIDPRALDGA
jgi:GAF domain-containing protein